MTSRTVETEYERKMLAKLVERQELPFTVDVTKGKRRTNEQNRLQRQWVKDIDEQMPGESPEYWRGYCKLHFGVPILRNDSEAFLEVYDRLIKPLEYEEKLALMMTPIDIAVTRIMTTKQKTAYLDAIFRAFTEQGVILTDPSGLIIKPQARAA